MFHFDSIVSTIPVKIKKNALGVHHYLDSLGKTEEEKVWMFYGFIGTYLTYDEKRFMSNDGLQYTPYTTVQKGKGVCRDFADLFDFFCEKSAISCIKIIGKSPTNFRTKFKRYTHGLFRDIGHEWNMVYVNNTWNLVDPTWSHIEKKTAVPVYDKKGKIIKKISVKSVSRDYYCASAEFMALTHAPQNPAFYMLAQIPTYKTAFKKHRQKNYAENFDFNTYLVPKPTLGLEEFNPAFLSPSLEYSESTSEAYFFREELEKITVKRTKYNPFTLQTYQEDSLRAANLYTHMQANFKFAFDIEYNNFLLAHTELKTKFLKAEAKKKK